MALIEQPSHQRSLGEALNKEPSARSPHQSTLSEVLSEEPTVQPYFSYVKMARIDQKSNACGGGYERHGTRPCSEKIPGASV